MIEWTKVSEGLPSVDEDNSSKVVLIYNKTRGWALGYLWDGKWHMTSENSYRAFRPTHWAYITTPDTKKFLKETLIEALK